MKGFTFDDIPGLTGRTALVTGANTGIGYHIAEMLADRGARVLMGCRDLNKAEAARKDMLKAVPDAQIELVELDLADMASVRKAAEGIDTLDLLVNNAGIAGSSRKLWECEPEEWQEVLQIDLFGVFLCCRALVPGMIAKGSVEE